MLRSPAALLTVAVAITSASFALVTACGDTDAEPSGEADPDGTKALEDGGDFDDDSAEEASADGATTDAGPDARSETEYSGEATYYYTTQMGACGIPTPPDDLVAAINDEQYSKENCGRCVGVEGPNGSVVVRIIDKCPGCDFGDLDLSDTAFTQIAEKSAGRVKITWKFTPCP